MHKQAVFAVLLVAQCVWLVGLDAPLTVVSVAKSSQGCVSYDVRSAIDCSKVKAGVFMPT